MALVLTALVLVGLCATPSRDVPFSLYPHLFYWTIGSTLVLSRVVAVFWLVGWALGPLWFYRAVSYYRRGATRSLLAAGLRGRWASTTKRATRFRLALRYAVSPTWLLIAQRQVTEGFEPVEPDRKPGRIGVVPGALAVLTISLNHWPVFTGVELALCVVPKWTITLPSWAGPCTFGAARGRQSPSSPCRELTPFP
ncbi:MAG: hypothetical protein EOO73_26525 [Myxococcales bacterium]|nr:MAG: hypothetical protein EOO73_26525 [Myxococcales bacterium]